MGRGGRFLHDLWLNTIFFICLHYILAYQHRIFKFLQAIPKNYGVLWGISKPKITSQSLLLAQNPDMKATLKCDTSSTRQVKCQLVDEKKLLGLIIRSDLKWVSNTENMVNKANKRLWILRRLKYLGAQGIDLDDIQTMQIKSVLEFAVPA